MFNIGDIVEHKIFGKGIVQKSNKDTTEVFFENNKELKLINNSFLTFVKKAEQNTTSTKELKVYPEDYSVIEAISPSTKELADYIKRNNIDGNLYLDISLFDDKDRKFSFLISSRGLCVFEFVPFDEEIFMSMKDTLLTSLDILKKTLIDKICNHLSLSNELVSDNNLIVPITHYLFISKDKEWIKQYISDDENILYENCLFSDKRESRLLERHIKIVANMLAPQYVVVLTRNSNHLNPKLKGISTTSRANGIELSILKDEQINTLFNLKNGIELILANAGAGKSVILLAKAYELCSLNYENVLLTCYNSNLAEEYRYKSEECGLNDKKDLYIMTFHKFVIKYCHDVFSKDYEIESMDEAVDFLIEKLSANRHFMRFDAILVDEMQIFETKWLDLCYLLLNDPKDDYFYILAGDINQDVKGISKDASLNLFETKYIPKDKKNIDIKYLNYNYRNTIQISNVLNKMLINHTELMKTLNVERIDKIDNYVLGESISEGPIPKYIKTKRIDITDKIVDEIVRLKQEYKLQYGDIAVIFPYQERVFIKYFLSKWLIDELNRRGIPFNFIFGDKNKTKLSSVDGVVLSTVDSALGLDFKAVIVCGLYTLTTNNYEDENGKVKTMKISTLPNNTNSSVFNDFILIEGYKLYIACSRAREYLTVINDIEEENLLVDSIFRGCF